MTTRPPRAGLLLLALLWGCSGGGEAPARPQSRTIKTESHPTVLQEPAGVPRTEARDLPGAGELELLGRAVPGILPLGAESQVAVYVALDTAPAPCADCGERSIATCILEEAAPECTVLVELGERAAALAAAGAPQRMGEAVAYPDLWFAEARLEDLAPGEVGVRVYADPAGPFAARTAGLARSLEEEEGVRVQVRPWAGEADGGGEAAGWCQAAVDAGSTGLACLEAVAELEAAGTPVTAVSLAEALGLPGPLGSGAEGLAATRAQAEELGVRASPTWFVQGHRLRGAQSAAAIGRLVSLERELGAAAAAAAP